MKILDLFETKPFDNTKIRDPYITAEAGVNHEGDFNIARRLIAEAAEAGGAGLRGREEGPWARPARSLDWHAGPARSLDRPRWDTQAWDTQAWGTLGWGDARRTALSYARRS